MAISFEREQDFRYQKLIKCKKKDYGGRKVTELWCTEPLISNLTYETLEHKIIGKI